MTNFAQSIRQGFDSAKRAQRNREEIREVIAAASADLAMVTDNQLTLQLEELSVSSAPWSIATAALVLGERSLPKELWLTARNQKPASAPGPTTRAKLARAEQASEGYPFTLIYDKREAHSHDRSSLEAIVGELLANATVGEQLTRLLNA